MSDKHKQHNHAAGNVAHATIGSVGSAVGSFQNRMHRRLADKEKSESLAQEERDVRHSLILKAMTAIRKALQETCKIRLSERFGFEIQVTDWEGWPRVELSLIDSCAPNQVDFGLVVTADDHKDRGLIKIATREGKILGSIELQKQNELSRLPTVLKRSIRTFLDSVGAYILNPPKPEDLLEVSTRPIDIDNAEPDHISASLANEDLFSEDGDYSPSHNVISPEDEEEPVSLAPLGLK